MTGAELIEMIQNCDGLDSEIYAYNGDTLQLESVTGCLYGGKDNIIELCTDDTD